MRTAVLVTGHPRTYKNTVKRLFENCVIPNNSDVFLSVWSSNEDGSQIDKNELFDSYQPLAVDISSENEYVSTKEHFSFTSRENDCFVTNIRAYLSLKTNGTRHIERIRSQWYRVKRGIELIRQHGKYDVILRTRFDIAYNGTVDFSSVEIDSQKYYIPTLLQSVHQDHFISCRLTTPVMTDHWCYGSWDSMMKYGMLYDQLLPMYRNENVPISNAEETFAHFMLTRIGKDHYIDGVPYELVR